MPEEDKKKWIERWVDGIASWLARSPEESPEETEREKEEIKKIMMEKWERFEEIGEKWRKKMRELIKTV